MTKSLNKHTCYRDKFCCHCCNSWVDAFCIAHRQYANMPTIYQEWRVRRIDTERWLPYRQLPYYLKQNVRRYDQLRWVATRGVDEETILRDLPADLRRLGFPWGLNFLMD